MTAPGLFCAHKRLRTACPECKAGAIPARPAEERPYAAEPPRRERAEAEPKAPRATGPGKPLLPSRPKRAAKPATRAEAENAEAWWTRRR